MSGSTPDKIGKCPDSCPHNAENPPACCLDIERCTQNTTKVRQLDPRTAIFAPIVRIITGIKVDRGLIRTISKSNHTESIVLTVRNASINVVALPSQYVSLGSSNERELKKTQTTLLYYSGGGLACPVVIPMLGERVSPWNADMISFEADMARTSLSS